MYKKAFFKYLFAFVFLFFLGTSLVGALNPSYLFLATNQINVANVEMVFVMTPSRTFQEGGEVVLSFPDANDEQWCKSNNVPIPVNGVISSLIDLEGWRIDTELPGDLTATCYQGSGIGSSDRVVISNLDPLSPNVSYGVKLGPSANLSTGSLPGSNNIIVELQRGLERETTAFSVNLRSPSGLSLQAFLNKDQSSVVQILNPTVERGMWSSVRIRVLDSVGNPLVGRQISLVFDSPIANTMIAEQLSGVTNSNGIFETRIRSFTKGLVKLNAVDRTLSQDITLDSIGNLNIVDVPKITLHQLQPLSTGLSRKITWNSRGSGYEYFIQASKDPNFNTMSSGWITENEYTFENLEHGVPYYYRGKVRNPAGVESEYSNVVSSVQGERLIGSVEVLDPVVEKGIWSRVKVRVTDENGNPMSGRRIILEIDRSDLSKWEIENPVALTDSNGVTEGRMRAFEIVLVKVTAIDRTIPQDNYLDGFDWLQITPHPTITLHSLPLYSKGLTRNVTWNLLPGNYEYYVEYATEPTFVISKNSGWMRLNSHTFTELKHAQGYFYRAKLRNSARVEGDFSNVVSSIQDNEPPVITEVSFEVVNNGVKFIFSTNSVSPVSSVKFVCKEVGSCGSISSQDRFHTVTLSRDALKKYLVSGDKYSFEYCMEAVDVVGNEGSNCAKKDFTLVASTTVEKTVSRTLLQRMTDPVMQNVVSNLEKTVVFVQDLNIDDSQLVTSSVAIVSTVTPLTVVALIPKTLNLYALLQGFLASSVLLTKRKKARPYGYIYDSVSKEPINRAIVRIYQGKKLLLTTVSNIYGVFNASLESGEYEMQVISRDYIYPSRLITGKVDLPLENIYRGGKFYVGEDEQIQYSIPLDPFKSSLFVNLRTKIFNYAGKFFKNLQKVLITVGLILAWFVYIRQPDSFNLAVLLVYIPLMFIHMFFSLGAKRYRSGFVTDVKGRVLPSIEIGLRELEFEKVITKRITDEKGKYKFLVPGGKYLLEILTPGYEVVHPKSENLIVSGDVKKPLLVDKRIILDQKTS